MLHYTYTTPLQTLNTGVNADDDVELHVLGCELTYLGTNCDQCVDKHGSVLLYVHRNRKAH